VARGTEPDPLTAAVRTVAWLIFANKPVYPLYVWWFAGSGVLASTLTAASAPLWAAMAWYGPRHPLLLRVGAPLVGLVDTLMATKLFGAASGTELFFIPCLLLAVLSFRVDETRISRALVAVLYLVVITAHGRYGAPWHEWPVEQLTSLMNVNALAVASLCAFIGWKFVGLRRG
jgi:hypothetical protein